MSERPELSILLVDDMASAKKDVERKMRLIGVSAAIDCRVPTDRAIPFGCELPAPSELDNYDLALIDLELFSPQRMVEHAEEDLRGGIEVLPYLRRSAPWLPVLAASKLFGSGADHLVALAGGFGFDGHIPRSLFTSDKLTRGLWDGIVDRATRHRYASAVGDFAYPDRDVTTPELECTAGHGRDLDKRIPAWRVVLVRLFPFAARLVATLLPGGFSGAAVLRVMVEAPTDAAQREGEWVVKISNSPSKLHREVRAHQEMIRSGLEPARAVQLLWPSVLTVNRTAAIAYQFVAGTREAAAVLSSGATPRELAPRIANVVRAMYAGASTQTALIARVTEPWRPRADVLRVARERITTGRTARLLDDLIAGLDEGELSRSVRYRRARIHGDLHLGNVMLGTHDVLIDFARSDVGPIVEDAAKLTSDLLVRRAELRGSEHSLDDLLSSARWKALEADLGEAFEMLPGERALFEVLLVQHFARILSYPTTTPETGEWIQRMLSGLSERTGV